jgi:hypothetical protein
MPALIAMLEHIEPVKRKAYRPLKIEQGRVNLEHKDGTMSLSFESDTFRQLDVVSLSGKISVSPENEISGTLDYGIPGMLTRVEYPDGQADPLFRDEGALAWVSTTLSGHSGGPTDNIEELERALSGGIYSRFEVESFKKYMCFGTVECHPAVMKKFAAATDFV